MLETPRDEEDPVGAIIDAFWEAVGAEEAFVPWLELTVAARTDSDLRKILADAAEDIELVVMANFRRLFDVDDRPDLVAMLSAVGVSVLQGLAMRDIIRPAARRTEAVLGVVKWVTREQLAQYIRK